MEDYYTIQTPDHHSILFQDLHILQKQGVLCDVILAAEDGEVMAHKVVLMAASKYFREKLSHAASTTASRICLKGISVVELANLVKYVYTGKLLVAKETMDVTLEISEILELNGVIRGYKEIIAYEQMKTSDTQAVTTMAVSSASEYGPGTSEMKYQPHQAVISGQDVHLSQTQVSASSSLSQDKALLPLSTYSSAETGEAAVSHTSAVTSSMVEDSTLLPSNAAEDIQVTQYCEDGSTVTYHIEQTDAVEVNTSQTSTSSNEYKFEFNPYEEQYMDVSVVSSQQDRGPANLPKLKKMVNASAEEQRAVDEQAQHQDLLAVAIESLSDTSHFMENQQRPELDKAVSSIQSSVVEVAAPFSSPPAAIITTEKVEPFVNGKVESKTVTLSAGTISNDLGGKTDVYTVALDPSTIKQPLRMPKPHKKKSEKEKKAEEKANQYRKKKSEILSAALTGATVATDQVSSILPTPKQFEETDALGTESSHASAIGSESDTVTMAISSSEIDSASSPNKSLVSMMSVRNDVESPRKKTKTIPKILLKSKYSKRNIPSKVVNDGLMTVKQPVECKNLDTIDVLIEETDNLETVGDEKGKRDTFELTETINKIVVPSVVKGKSENDPEKDKELISDTVEDFGQVVNFDSDDEGADDGNDHINFEETTALQAETEETSDLGEKNQVDLEESARLRFDNKVVPQDSNNETKQKNALQEKNENKAGRSSSVIRTRASSKKDVENIFSVMENMKAHFSSAEEKAEDDHILSLDKTSSVDDIIPKPYLEEKGNERNCRTPEIEAFDKKEETEMQLLDSPTQDKIRSSASKRKGKVPRRLALPADAKSTDNEGTIRRPNVPIVRTRKNSKNDGGSTISINGKSSKAQIVTPDIAEDVSKGMPSIRTRRNSKNEGNNVANVNKKVYKSQKGVDSCLVKETSSEKTDEHVEDSDEMESLTSQPIEVSVTVECENKECENIENSETKSKRKKVGKRMLPHVRLEKHSTESMLALAKSIASSPPKFKTVGEFEIEIDVDEITVADVNDVTSTTEDTVQETEYERKSLKGKSGNSTDMTLNSVTENKIKTRGTKRNVLTREKEDTFEEVEINKRRIVKRKKIETNDTGTEKNKETEKNGNSEEGKPIKTMKTRKSENEKTNEGDKSVTDSNKKTKTAVIAETSLTALVSKKSKRKSGDDLKSSGIETAKVEIRTVKEERKRIADKLEDENMAFICPEEDCLFTSKMMSGIRKHRIMFHGIRESPQKPIKAVNSAHCVVKEEKAESSSDTLTCNCCNVTFKSMALLQNHVKEMVLGEAECELCGDTFKLGYTFVSHQMKEHGVSIPKHLKRFDCPKCEFVGFSFKQIDAHFATHEGQLVPCIQCDKTFKTYREMKSHLVIHKGKRFQCLHCDYSAPTRASVNTHVNIKHSKEKKLFGCQFCLYKTPLLGNLRKHMYSGHSLIVVTKLSKENREKFADHPDGTILLLDGTVFDPATMPLPKTSIRRFMNKTLAEIKKEEAEKKRKEKVEEKKNALKEEESRKQKNRRISLYRLPPEEFAKELMKRHEEYLKKPEKTQKFMSKSLAVATAHPSFPQASPSVRGTKANKLYNSPKIRHQYQELTPQEAEHFLTVNTCNVSSDIEVDSTEPMNVVLENVEEEYAQDGVVVSIPETHQSGNTEEQLIVISSDGKESVVRSKDFYHALIEKGQNEEANQTMGVISALLEAGEQIQIQEREDDIEIQNE